MNVKAYAKINLILNVLGKRDDGYHEIETIFQAIDLYDLVSVECSKTKGFTEIHLSCVSSDDSAEDENKKQHIEGLKNENFEKHHIEDLENKNNLAYKAAILMHDTYHGRENEIIDIEIDKRIPVSGGLAGGSADAAAVVNALCALWGIAIDSDVYSLCSQLGADVAFCLAAQNGMPCALARGIGEKLEYANGIDCDIELLLSDISIPNKTARVYSEFDKISGSDKNESEKKNEKLRGLNLSEEKTSLVKAFIDAASREEKISLLHNDLQTALENITGIKIDDYILCGAGPTYFRIARPDEDKGFIVHTL